MRKDKRSTRKPHLAVSASPEKRLLFVPSETFMSGLSDILNDEMDHEAPMPVVERAGSANSPKKTS